MKHKVTLLLFLALLPAARAEEARFFRIAGPVVSTITAFSADGYVTWTNETTNATFIVQTALSLVGPSNWVDYIQVPVTNSVTRHRLYDPNPPAGMALIPAGSFTMGDTLGDGNTTELPLRFIYVSAFYLDRSEVTKALWDDVYNWALTNGYSFDHAGFAKATNHPVSTISWYDSVKWCNARSEKEGRMPAYYIDAAQTTVFRRGQTNVQNDWVKWVAGYRLPTEAEWEKAARGGPSGHRFPWADTDNITHDRANYFSRAQEVYDTSPTRGYHPAFDDGVMPYTSPVGYFAPTGYGLYDLAGNVSEWCWDWGYLYPAGPQIDPRGPTSAIGSYRVDRGGFFALATYCRVAARDSGDPSSASVTLGLRSLLPVVP